MICNEQESIPRIRIIHAKPNEGQIGEPLYLFDDNGDIIVDDGGTDLSSFFQEYHYKLKKVYDYFYTERAKEIAVTRQRTAIDFYHGLFAEISDGHGNGISQYMASLPD